MLAWAAHILKLEHTEKISMAPAQGWHANSWSVPYLKKIKNKIQPLPHSVHKSQLKMSKRSTPKS